jgi:hypothetical protein
LQQASTCERVGGVSATSRTRWQIRRVALVMTAPL